MKTQKNRPPAMRRAPLTGSVWVVMAHTPYEGSSFVAAYGTEGAANARKDKIEKASRRYDEVQCKADYMADIKMPEYHNDDIAVFKTRILNSRNVRN